MSPGKKPLRLLIIEDSEDDAFFIVRAFTREGYQIDFSRVETASEMRQAFGQGNWDAVISDYQLPFFDGLSALEIFKEYGLDIPFIIVSGAIGEETAVRVMKAGAHDYIIKDNLARLVPAIERELGETKLRQERTEAIQKLQHSESRYRAIVEDQTELINRSTLDGTILFVNNAYARMLDCTPEDLIGKKYTDFLPETNARQLEKIRSSITEIESVITNVTCLPKKDGSVVWVQWRDRLIFDAEGHPIEYQGVGRDITEQRQAEEELKGFAVNLERRAVQIQVASEIARDATSIRELDDLLDRSVNLVRDRFDFYYVGVFLVDEAEEFVVLTAATGTAGRKLLAVQHRLRIGETGIVGSVGGTGQPLIVLDVEEDSVHQPQPLLPKTRSEMALPLKVSDRVIGVLDVQSEIEDAFDEQDVQILQTLADQLAIGIDNLRLLDVVQQRARELESLYSAALVTSSELEVDALLSRFYEQVQQLISPDSFMVALYDEDTDEYEIPLAIEAGELLPHFTDMRKGTGKGGLSGYVIRSRRSLLIRDAESENLPVEPIYDPDSPHPTLSWLGVPLIAHDRVLGVVSVQSFKRDAFDEEDQRFLESLGLQVSIALENASFFEAERTAREQAETLREMVRVISGSLELDQVLHLILEQIKRVVYFDTASVLLFDEQQETAFVAGLGFQDERITSKASGKMLTDSKILQKMSQDLQHVIIPNVRENPLWIWVPGADHVRSFLGVPIIIRQEMAGAFMADRVEVNSFREEDARTLQVVARHISIAIETARLFEAEREQVTLARTLQEVGMLLSSELGLGEVLERILGLLGRVVQYDSLSVQLIDADGQFYYAAGRGFEDPDTIDQFVRGMSEVNLDRLDRNKGQVIVITDTVDYETWRFTPGFDKIRSWIGAPLLARGRLIGLLTVDSFIPNLYTEEIAATVMVFASQAAIAIENAQLFESERTARERSDVLRRAVQVISSTLSLDQVIQVILKQLARVLQYDSGSVILVKGNSAFVQAGYGYEGIPDSVGFPEIEFDMSVESIRYVIEERKPLMIPEVVEDPRWQHTPLTGQVRSWTGIPLQTRDQVIGIINLERNKPGGFSADEVELAQIFATHTSTAIENARLFEAEENRAFELETLRKVSLSLTASLELDAVIAAIIEGVFELMPRAWHVNIYRYENGTLVYGADSWADESSPFALVPLSKGCIMEDAAVSGEMRVTSAYPLNRIFDLPDSDELFGSIICIPLKLGDRVDGVLNVVYLNPQSAAPRELDVMNLLADQAALAMENARRYQDVDRLVSLLASEQSRLEGLIEMLPVGVLLLDEAHTLLVTNSLAREFLADLSPGQLGSVLSTIGELSITEILGRHIDPLPVEITVEGPPNKVFEIQAQSIATETPQWVITLRDVTQEREIQDGVQMQERLATVGQLAAGIAHDFNNIMAAIVVYADLLQMDPDLSPSSRDRLTIIQQQVERAASLIRQILDFSRRSVMEQSALDILPLLKETEKLLVRTLPETIDVNLMYQDGEYLLSADPTRMQQVFMNLAVNARDAMPDGGHLYFEISHLTLRPSGLPPIPEMPPGDWVCIQVRDTGVGIPAEKQIHIFEPFFTTKPVGQGTGLGLAQVYGIIKQHGGFIDIQSQVGQGTKFTIYLPALSKPETVAKQDEHFTTLDGGGKYVLLVEDDYTTRKALRAMLSMHNYRVLTAENGAEALEHLERNADHIVLVVSDIVMPQMGGFDLYDKMRQSWPQIEILFITGHPLDEQNQEILQQGKVHWLQKPFTVQEFNQTLIELLV